MSDNPLASPTALAVGKLEFYGKLHVAIQNEEVNIKVDEEGTTYLKDDAWNVVSQASRLGLNGKFDLANEISAIYKLEWQVNIFDEDNDSIFTPRNQFGGLKGGFGSAVAGRHDTPVKMSQGKYDLFNDTFGDIKTLMSGERRADSMVLYGLPDSLGSFKDYGQWIAGEDSGEDYSDSSDWSFMGAYKSKMIYGSIAYNLYGGTEDSSLTRLTGIVPIGNFGLGAIFSSGKPEMGDTQYAWSANAYWKVGNGELKLQCTDSDGQSVGKLPTVEEGGKLTSIGYNHNLGKRTYVYVDYHILDIQSDVKNNLSVFALGFVTRFGGKILYGI